MAKPRLTGVNSPIFGLEWEYVEDKSTELSEQACEIICKLKDVNASIIEMLTNEGIVLLILAGDYKHQERPDPQTYFPAFQELQTLGLIEHLPSCSPSKTAGHAFRLSTGGRKILRRIQENENV